MANTKISDLTALGAAPAAGDLIPLVDISDATMSAQGTDKSITAANLIGGAWTSYSPQVDQGVTDIAHTNNYTKYIQIGKTVFVGIRIAMTAGGTAGQTVFISLPIAEAATSVNVQCGSGNWYDSSTTDRYRGVCQITGGAQKFSFFRTDSTANTAFGGDPNLALASGDILNATIIYEAA